MESMVIGIPVIATNVPGSRSLVRQNENGLLVEDGNIPQLAEAIQGLIGSPDVARRLANAGKQTILREYNEHDVVTRIEQVYRHTLENGQLQLSDLT